MACVRGHKVQDDGYSTPLGVGTGEALRRRCGPYVLRDLYPPVMAL
jgi:hypothetical protein